MRMVRSRSCILDAPPLTPQEAWERGRALDAMLPIVALLSRGVVRLTHAQRNAADDARMLEVAQRLNTHG